jgi:serine/threonine protein kinase
VNVALSDETLRHLRAVADEPDLTGTKYQLLGAIGKGGMATVYAARDTELDRDVAVKVLSTEDDALAERLLREARILAHLEHPGIVPVHDVGRLPDGRVFYVMKRVRGRRLDEFIEGASRDERLRMFPRICDAVAFAHAHGVLHRDLKPANIMVGEFGEILVLDWGVAKLALPEPNAAAPHGQGEGTAHGTTVGTPGWMAPEQAGSASIDARSDVYGLGAILHFLLFNRPPGTATLAQRPAGMPRRLHAILRCALAPDPSHRYASVSALSDDVQRYLAGASVAAYREPAIERAVRFAWKYRTPIALILGYVLIRVLLLLFAGDE